jgi:hypothetical protein
MNSISLIVPPLNEMSRNSKVIALTVGIAATNGVSLVALLTRKPQTVGLNQEIQYEKG